MWKGLGKYKEVCKDEVFVVVVVCKTNNFPSSIHCGKILTLTAGKVPGYILSFKQTKRPG